MASRLADRGAEIVDADLIAKDLQRPGGSIFEGMVTHFGDRIVGDDGELNRQVVADIVFNDPDELAALNKIAHPAVRAEMSARAAAADTSTDRVVVMDIPLFAESRAAYTENFSGIIVVDCPPPTAVERLIEHRGFSQDDAEARIANQADRDERLALGDFIVDNGGDVAQLDAEVERLWQWLDGRPVFVA